jgi:peroxiredoxin
MASRPSAFSATLLAALAIFTVWIGWRAKAVEMRLHGHDSGQSLRGRPAPDFQLATLDGRTVHLADYRGRHVVVGFWASWCGPCRIELPVLRKFYMRARKTEAESFEILAVNLDQDPEAARRAAAEWKLPFPVPLDPEFKVSSAYAVEGIPALFVIDPAGKIQSVQTGFSPGTEILLATELGLKNYNPLEAAKPE